MTNTTPAPVDPALQQRIADAIYDTYGQHDHDRSNRIAAAVLAELAPELGQLAAFHEGEQPYTDEATIPTPAQWIWQWNRATPVRRLEVAAAIQNALDRADRCFMGHHEGEIEQLRARAEQAEAALAAGIPLICTDERHQAKVTALEAQVRRLGDLIDRLGPTEQKHRDDLATARAILADLTDPDPCWYDHHGYCQAHAWLATTPACPHARAKALTQSVAPEDTP